MNCFFYDTCSLLYEADNLFKDDNKEFIFISEVTLHELENIKTSAHKDEEVKFRARKVIKLLSENYGKFKPIQYLDEVNTYHLPDTPDMRILSSAMMLAKENDDIPFIFYTKDLSLYNIASWNVNNYWKIKNLKVVYKKDEKEDSYCGFKILNFNTQEELSNFYSNDLKLPYLELQSKYQILLNEYLLIKDSTNSIVDKYKVVEEGLKPVPFYTFKTDMFGSVKPKDDYQHCVMDSLATNKITMIRGAAGSGKSYLAFSYLFKQLEKGKIDKIIIFCNTVATAGSAKLGFYPGTRDEKLLDSQIGNFLSSKLGDKSAVEDMINKEKIILLPLSDIRGYDTTGMNAGIYITEAQNLDIELMRLALQRIGEDSFCILDGDSDAQVDLPLYAGDKNGMRRVSEVFRGDPCYGEVTLQNIHRSHIAALAQKL